MPDQAARVLVTGGIGFIGSRLCEALLRQGRSVLCVDDLSGRHARVNGAAAGRRLRALGAEVALADAASVAVRDVQAVVHLAGLPGVRSRRPPREIWAANASLTMRLVEAAAESGARFVLGSTSSVYGDAARLPTPEHAPPAPLNAYARSKLAAEAAVRAAARRGASALIVRMFSVYGPGQRPEMAFARWIRALADGQPLPWYAPAGAARDFTYVDDVVDGLLAALDRGRAGEAYNIAGGGPVPLAVPLALLENELGRSAELERQVRLDSEARVTWACGAKSAGELGYAPRVDLATGLRLQLAAAPEASSAERPGGRRRAPAAPRRFGRGSGAGAPAPGSPRPGVRPAAATFRG